MLSRRCLAAVATHGRRLASSSSSAGLGVREAMVPAANAAEENTRLRRHLALAHRLLDRMGLNEGVCNHLSVMAPAKNGGDEKVMLVVPGCMYDGSALHWSRVTASSLVGVDPDAGVVEPGCWGGEPEHSAACIHLGLRKVRPDAKVVFHVHSHYATAQGCLLEPDILPVHQNSARFTGRTAYDNDYAFPGVTDVGESIARNLGDKAALLMVNHGSLVVADNVPLAFDDTYYLERACMYQMTALAAMGGREGRLAVMDEKLLATTAAMYTPEMLDKYAARHFYAYWNDYAAAGSDVFE